MNTIHPAHEPIANPLPPSSAWRELCKDAGMWAAGNCGQVMHRLAGSRTSDTLGILTYHRVAPITRGVPAPLHNVTPQRLYQQLSGLLQQGLTPWPLRQVLEYRRLHIPIPEKVFVVTFDDGFESVYTHAWGILKELNIPATVFLNTAYLNQVEPFPFDLWGQKWQGKTPAEHYRPLSVSQCRAMQAGMLIDLGAHTHTHQDFRGRAQEFRNDLLINIAHLHETFGIEQPMFAFPFGSPHLNFAGGELERMARTCGVTCGLTTKCDLVNVLEDDPFRWGRLNVFAWDTANTLAAKLAGWYSWAPELRQKFAQALQTAAYISSMQIAQHTNLLSEV